MEADYDAFVKHEPYYKAMPRSSTIEQHALDLNMIQRGQLRPIKVNCKMWILDGYTRHWLLGQRGVKIKYIFMDFENEEDEYSYVKETNVMRRQLNPFQRVETMYDLLKRERHERREKAGKTYVDIMFAIQGGKTSAKSVAKHIGMAPTSTSRTMKEMTIKCYLSRKFKSDPLQGESKYVYSVSPKGEEQLQINKNEKLGRVHITDIIGVHEYTISKVLYLLENADEVLLDMLRDGRSNILDAYSVVMGRAPYNHKKHIVWGKFTKIKCPSCNHVGTKEDYIKVEV